jgi:hypothetical protein
MSGGKKDLLGISNRLLRRKGFVLRRKTLADYQIYLAVISIIFNVIQTEMFLTVCFFPYLEFRLFR